MITRVSPLDCAARRVAYCLDHDLSSYWMARAPEILRWLEPNSNDVLLDIGCGTGRWALFMQPLVGEVYGLDVEMEALRHIVRNPEIRLACASAEALPFRDAWASKVLAVDVIEHVPSDVALIGEACRVLRPGGHLVVTTLLSDRPHYVRRMTFDDHLREYSVDDLVSLFEHCELEIVSVFFFYYALRMIAREIQALAEQLPLGDSIGVKVLSGGAKVLVGIGCRVLGDLERMLRVGKPAGVGLMAVKRLPNSERNQRSE